MSSYWSFIEGEQVLEIAEYSGTISIIPLSSEDLTDLTGMLKIFAIPLQSPESLFVLFEQGDDGSLVKTGLLIAQSTKSRLQRNEKEQTPPDAMKRQ